ncbi:MAG TPA: ArsR family transcriptional regulator [Euryarchaeota archaeon]|nr:ArsR family transcriptional regulator [Euryarchaeota archaeon]
MTDLERLMSPDADCRDLLRIIYALTDAETEILSILISQKEVRIDDLSDIVGKDKSTVYRSLQRLVGCRLVYKEKRIIEKGGYYHVYKPISKDELKRQIHEYSNRWHERMRELAEMVDTLNCGS